MNTNQTGADFSLLGKSDPSPITSTPARRLPSTRSVRFILMVFIAKAALEVYASFGTVLHIQQQLAALDASVSQGYEARPRQILEVASTTNLFLGFLSIGLLVLGVHAWRQLDRLRR